MNIKHGMFEKVIDLIYEIDEHLDIIMKEIKKETKSDRIISEKLIVIRMLSTKVDNSKPFNLYQTLDIKLGMYKKIQMEYQRIKHISDQLNNLRFDQYDELMELLKSYKKSDSHIFNNQ